MDLRHIFYSFEFSSILQVFLTKFTFFHVKNLFNYIKIFVNISDRLITCNIVQIACGTHHVIALSSNRKLYTWGLSEDGQLGLDNRQFRFEKYY